MGNFKPYKRIELYFQGELKKYFIVGPLDKGHLGHAVRAKEIYDQIYQALAHTENINLGLGTAHPDERIDVRMDSVDTYDSSETGPISIESAMVGQMIHIFKESLFTKEEPPKMKWTLGRALKTLWNNFMEFLDELGVEVQKNPPDPFGNTHNWM